MSNSSIWLIEDPIEVSMNPEAIEMKVYSAFPKAAA